MGRIYESAANVIVWLDSGGEGNDEAFDFLKSTAIVKGQGKEAVDCFLQEFLTDLCQRLQSLHLLALRPWFSRTWVVQEVVVSTREPIFCCGRRAIMIEKMMSSLSMLLEVLEMSRGDRIRYPGLSDITLEHDLYLVGWTTQLFTLNVFRMRRQYGKTGLEFSDLLAYTTYKDATDP